MHRSVPVLSKDKIDELGESFVKQFCPDVLVSPRPIDVDRLCAKCGANLDYQDLTHSRVYLGMFVFEQSDFVPVFDFDSWCAKFISVPAETIIIDNCLLQENQEHRYRFTVMHELSHGYLHREYFLSGTRGKYGYLPAASCSSRNLCRPSGAIKTDAQWVEWQANKLASAILMPKSITTDLACETQMFSRVANEELNVISKTFNVSTEAAHYRLVDLGLRQK